MRSDLACFVNLLSGLAFVCSFSNSVLSKSLRDESCSGCSGFLAASSTAFTACNS